MDWSAALVNLQNPPSLFFLLGLLAPLLRCPLEIPAPVTKPIALYLLWAIGFKAGSNWRAAVSAGRCCRRSPSPSCWQP